MDFKRISSFTLSLLLISSVMWITADSISEVNAISYSSSKFRGAMDLDMERQNYLSIRTDSGTRNYLFPDSTVDWCVNTSNSTFYEVAKKSVETWSNELAKFTNNTDAWKMTVSQQNDAVRCDAFINYFTTPDLLKFQLYGVAGFSHPSTPNANVTIYTDFYTEALRQLTEKDWQEMTKERLQDIVKNGTHPTLNQTALERITLHELGHAFGVHHPLPITANGIMGYNMSWTEILPHELLTVVKIYPDGFAHSETIFNYSFQNSVDLNNQNATMYVGQKVYLYVEIPYSKSGHFMSSAEISIFPDGRKNQQKNSAPIQFGCNSIIETATGEYITELKEMRVILVNNKWLCLVTFVLTEEFKNADVIVKTTDELRFTNEYEMKNVFSSVRGLFSNMLLDNHHPSSGYRFIDLYGVSPNRSIEHDTYDKAKQTERYHQAIVECLYKHKTKYCNETVKFDDFKINRELAMP